ncbi:hypothetical protein E2C01_079072 [Portunus trituberculatus]|uniref:Uncharacterized protein n=1 Tax=Portunus trituberculatus TaxID=210409 RepID=A0A5B7IPB2_PORTR|nr:hypothetical protein [Portunus trituberculatus]
MHTLIIVKYYSCPDTRHGKASTCTTSHTPSRPVIGGGGVAPGEVTAVHVLYTFGVATQGTVQNGSNTYNIYSGTPRQEALAGARHHRHWLEYRAAPRRLAAAAADRGGYHAGTRRRRGAAP